MSVTKLISSLACKEGQNPLFSPGCRSESPERGLWPLQSYNHNTQKGFLIALPARGHNPLKEVLSQVVTIPTPIQGSLVPRVFQTHVYHGNHPFRLFPMDETKSNPIYLAKFAYCHVSPSKCCKTQIKIRECGY